MRTWCGAHGHAYVKGAEPERMSWVQGVGRARAYPEAEPKGRDQKLGQGLGLRVEPRWMPRAEPGWLYDVIIQMWMA